MRRLLVAGEVILQTVSGRFDIESDRLGRARIRTKSGNASLRSGLAEGALNGQINNAFGPEPVRTSRYGPGRELRFATGAGSARVTMETVDGDIILRAE